MGKYVVLDSLPTHKVTITAAGKAARKTPVIKAREDPCLSQVVGLMRGRLGAPVDK
jgi:hypothetical protein